MSEQKSVFDVLNAVNVNEHTEKKNGLTYLSWAWAWAEVKKRYPEATYRIYENKDEYNYHTDGKTCWVKTSVTIEGIEYIEYLPVMDFKNVSIPVDRVTSFDVNKAIQRSLTKALARHGLGLYIYAGEDLPEGEDTSETPAERKPLSAELLKEADALGIELPNVCKYFKKRAEELTDEDLRACIDMKRKNLAKKKAEAVTKSEEEAQ